MDSLTLNTIRTLSKFFQTIGAIDGRNRQIEAEAQIETNYDARTYWKVYDSWSIAQRVVNLYPIESFQAEFFVYEKDRTSINTQWEKRFASVAEHLNTLPSFIEPVASVSPIWGTLRRWSELAGVGRYGILVIGTNDGTELDKPVGGMEIVGSSPISDEDLRANNESKKRPQPVYQRYEITNNATKETRKLLSLEAYPEYYARPVAWEWNQASPRFGQPVMYSITPGFTEDDAYTEQPKKSTAIGVHWTRVIHLTDAGAGMVFGRSRMKSNWPHITMLRQIYAASGEGAWQNAFPTTFLETHPQLGGDVEIDEQNLKDMMENIRQGMQRFGTLRGMSAKNIGGTALSPQEFIQVHLEAICYNLACPMRIFLGSERGELASSQDEGTWNGRLNEWNKNHTIPLVISPFIDRLIYMGILPKPENKLKIEASDLSKQSDKEKGEVGKVITEALRAYVDGGVSAVIQPYDFLVEILGVEEERATRIIEESARVAASGDNDQSQSPLLSLVGGITGMIELFKAASEGIVSEEQLKQLLMLLFKLTPERASEVIADGVEKLQQQVEGGFNPLADGNSQPNQQLRQAFNMVMNYHEHP